MDTTKNFKIFSALVLSLAIQGFSLNSDAMAKKKPKATPVKPAPAPTPAPPSTREPAAVTDPLTPEGFDVFREVAYEMGGVVDDQYRSYRELLPQRNSQSAYRTDLCDPSLDGQDSFADRVSYAVELKMQPSQAQLGYVASYYNMNSNPSTYFPNSLISHPICNVTSSTLNTTLSGRRVPSSSVIQKANQFADTMNDYRRQALSGDREGYVKASKLWSKYMMCLSYVESLTTADTNTSNNVANKYAPTGYRRPAGVKFYEDSLQPEASRLNIGLFQFTPTASGNIQACIREWNLLYPSCRVSQTASRAEMIQVVGSSLQTFNAFCAAAKVTGMFAVQINSSSSTNTHPYNVNSNGRLKSPAERCVTPHIAAGKSYNHFGPFQNSTGSNLDRVLSCALAGE